MSRQCDRCGNELGMFYTNKTTADGRVVTVCATCAAGVSPPQPTAGPAPYVPRAPGASGSAAAAIAIAAAALVIVAGAGAFFLLLRARPASPPPSVVTTARAKANPVETAAAAEGRTGEVRWSGTETFRCNTQDNVVLRDCASALNNANSSAVRAEGGCKLTLINCKLVGNPAIDVQNDAEVTMQGGELSSPSGFANSTIRMNNNAKLSIESATVVGAGQGVRLGGSSKLMFKNVVVHQAEGGSNDRTPFACALELRDDSEAVIEGGKIDWTGQGVRMTGSPILIARGVNITAERAPGTPQEPSALKLTDAAVGLVMGGTLKGPRVAALVNDVASLTLERVQTLGEVRSEGNATLKTTKDAQSGEISLEQLQETMRSRRAELKPEHDKIGRYSRTACDGVFACYSDNFPGGAVAGTVLMRVNGEGKVQTTTLQGNIPAKVAQCIRGLGKDRSIQNFQGPKGELVCEYSGTIVKGTQMLSIKSDFRKVP